MCRGGWEGSGEGVSDGRAVVEKWEDSSLTVAVLGDGGCRGRSVEGVSGALAYGTLPQTGTDCEIL